MKWDIYSILSLVFFAIIVGFTVAIICVLSIKAKRDKAEFRKEVRSWKYGKFLWVYLIAFPLFILSFVAEGQDAGYCIFKALTNAFKLMALQFDFDLSLVASNVMYKAAIYTCYIVATLNVVLFIVSCVNQSLRTFFITMSIKFGSKRKDVIVGNIPTSEELYKTIPKKDGNKIHHKKAILDVISKDDKWLLFSKGIHYISDSSVQRVKNFLEALIVRSLKKYERIQKKINILVDKKNKTKSSKKSKRIEKRIEKLRSKQRVTIFINFKNDSQNVEFCAFLSDVIAKYITEYINKMNEKNSKDVKKGKQKDNKKIDPTKLLAYLDIYVYSSLQYSSIYEGYIKNLKGCLHLIDKEKVIAYTFADEHPVALYMTQKHVDFKTSTLKPDTNVSINFLGMGKTSQQLFLTLYSNTQFVRKNSKTKKIEIAPVNFNLYDSSSDKMDNKLLNNTLNKYSNWLEKNKNAKGYYPIPETNKINTYFGRDGDVNSTETKNNFYKSLENPEGKNINYVIISLGDDFESIDIANRVYNTVKSNSKYRNCYIFVRIDDNSACLSTIKLYDEEKDKTTLIGTCGENAKTIFNNIKNKYSIDDKCCSVSASNLSLKYKKDKIEFNLTFSKDKTEPVWHITLEGDDSTASKINVNFFESNLDVHCKRFIYGSYYSLTDKKEDNAVQVVYDYKKIIPDTLLKIAVMQNEMYQAVQGTNPFKQKCLVLSSDSDIVQDKREQWSVENDEFARNSSFHSALNLRSKLLLMGLNYVPEKDEADSIDNYKIYWKILSSGVLKNRPHLGGSQITVGSVKEKGSTKEEPDFKNIIVKKGKKLVKFIADYSKLIVPGAVKEYEIVKKDGKIVGTNYKNGSACLVLSYDSKKPNIKKLFNNRRWTLVNLEHNRWNAFMMSIGYRPLAKEKVKTTGMHKEREQLTNACITTMEGLIMIHNDLVRYFKKQCANKQKPTNLNELFDMKNLDAWANKINYDYLQFDPAWHLLKRVGCKMIYSKNCPESIKIKNK